MKPSVVFFNRVYPPVKGATGRVLRDLARAFARDGWNVTVVTTGPEDAIEYDGDVRLIRVRAPLKSKKLSAYFRIWLRLLWTGLRLEKKDLIVTMTDPPMLVVAGRILAHIKKARHIHWCQDLYPDLLPALGMPVPGWMMDVMRKMSRQAMKSCEKIVVVGRCMARQLTLTGVDPTRITLIPNWPDLEILNAPQRRRKPSAAFRTVNGQRVSNDHVVDEDDPALNPFFNEQDPKFRILYAGNLGRAHPVQTVLEAASLLNQSNPEIEFVFVGDGPNIDRLAQERAKRGLENIRFLPFQPANRLRSLMESGDVHLISMKHEATGLLVPCKLYSALAVGRPCILVGPMHCETAKVIADFNAGAVVPQGEAALLAETILRFRNNGDDWFEAHQGAAEAGRIFVPGESTRAWIKRARDIVRPIYIKRRKAA